MEEREKLLAAVTNAVKSTRIEVLVQLMELWGFSYRYTSSHDNIIFQHSLYPIQPSAGVPHHGPVLGHYVRKCLRAIDEVVEREAGSDA